MSVRKTASHPAVGIFIHCDRCGWSWGFAPAIQARLAGLWHWAGCRR